jgi:hypothetical protein
MKSFAYGDRIELLTPQGVTVQGQIVSVGRWDRSRVVIPSWQQERNLNELLADGWQLVENAKQLTP